MSGFVAGGPTSGGQVTSDAFWPSIDLGKLRESLRIDSSVTPARLRTAVMAATIAVNNDLAVWREAKQAAGASTLAEIPSGLIEGESQLVYLYQRAVECAAGAEVCERYRGYDTTGSGDKSADEDAPTIDDYRRDQRWAIRDLLGTSRTTVELL